MDNMGIAYHTPYSYQSRQYQQSTGIQAYNNETAGHYNLNVRAKSTPEFPEQVAAYPSGNRMINGACNQPQVLDKDINSYPTLEIRTAHSEIRSQHHMVPPPPISFAMNRDKRKGGRFFRRLIRPFRNLIKRPQPSEKFMERSQGLLIIRICGS